MAKHFDENGNEIRCVYLFEFSDGYCYVGTTNDENRRIDDHLYSDKKSEVYQHKHHTGLIPTFRKLHDYTSIEEADRLEHFHTIEYAKQGRKILNVQKPGGYGHKENNVVTPRYIKGKINEYAEPYNVMAENEKNTFRAYRYNHKGEYSDSVKKVYDILIALCKRAYEQGGERIYIRKSDIPYTFDCHELNSYNNYSPIKSNRVTTLCVMSFVDYKDEEQKSYIECSKINDKIEEYGVLCQYDNIEEFENSCNDIYKKCYIFKRTDSIKKYSHDNFEVINNESLKLLINHNITAPFSKEVQIEGLGYKEDMKCSKVDYAVMLQLDYQYFFVFFDKNWGLSSISLCVPYNSYSLWAKQNDLYEMQNPERQSKFRKLVEKIDNFILSEKNKITDFPKRIEILVKDLGITDVDTLRSFMRHFYISHGTVWDTNSHDSCICSIEDYNEKNMNGCKLIIDIQGYQFFKYYDLKTHTLNDSNSYLNSLKR